MSLLDSVNSLSDYLNQGIKAANKSATASSKREVATPDGQLKSALQNQTSANTLDQLKQNPILNTAIDTANQTITTIAQQSVRNAITKINLTPIQNATSQFFTLFASVTSFGTEVAMALARNTATNLKGALAQKDAIADKLDIEIMALYNACAIMLNGQPFFDGYLKAITQAYSLIQTADNNLKNVAQKLGPNTKPAPFYQVLKFNTSITQLTQARDLILPDRSANVNSIRSTGAFISQQLQSQSTKNVYAAALSIPGITLQIGKLALQYEVASVNVNAYINTYVNALNDYIAGYTQSTSVNQATIDHITAGTSQLDNLLAQMNTILSQNTGSTTDVGFRTKLSTSGTTWGVSLTGIIEWLKLNPGAGSALLTKTTASVTAYTKSRALILAIGNKPFPGGTVIVNHGQEDAFAGFMRPIAKLLTTANTIVATSNSKTDVRNQGNAVRGYIRTSKLLDAQILAAIQPFINTKTTVSGDVGKGLSQLLSFANKTGLDRLAGLLTNGNVKDLFSATPDTATFAGAAVVGINSVITNLQALPSATTQQISKMETLRDQVSREQKAKEQYAGRSAQSTQNSDTAQQQSKVQSNKVLVQSATEAAKQIDATAANDPVENTEIVLASKVTPGGLPSSSDAKAAF